MQAFPTLSSPHHPSKPLQQAGMLPMEGLPLALAWATCRL